MIVVARVDPDRVVIAVSDAGSGVPDDVLPRLFERFGKSRGGTGLGLYIVRELAQAQGGDARYDPDRQTFEVRLPREEMS